MIIIQEIIIIIIVIVMISILILWIEQIGVIDYQQIQIYNWIVIIMSI